MHLETKAGYYRPRISPIDTTLPIKKGGVPFRLGFFQQTVFQAAGVHPPLFSLNPPWLYRKINNAALFSARKACTDTAHSCVCSRHAHIRTLHWVANIFSVRIIIFTATMLPLMSRRPYL